ncbi:MAG TPA: hypothetical protein VMO88_09525 [Acidimicrobiales bacterium]|nr:hypothetical protein [Acidimicrobiales bacterium]
MFAAIGVIVIVALVVAWRVRFRSGGREFPDASSGAELARRKGAPAGPEVAKPVASGVAMPSGPAAGSAAESPPKTPAESPPESPAESPRKSAVDSSPDSPAESPSGSPLAVPLPPSEFLAAVEMAIGQQVLFLRLRTPSNVFKLEAPRPGA